jgi:hypothetical protein
MDRLPTTLERRKRTLIESELQKGKLLVHFDPRGPTVEVPKDFKVDPVLALNFSHQFPFANTTVTPLTLQANLSFGGVRHWCEIPYAAIFCVTQASDNEQHWFEDSLPEELRQTLSGNGVTAEMSEDEATPAPKADTITSDTSSRVSHLKLVK